MRKLRQEQPPCQAPFTAAARKFRHQAHHCDLSLQPVLPRFHPKPSSRHPSESWDPDQYSKHWIPAFAGMTTATRDVRDNDIPSSLAADVLLAANMRHRQAV